MPTSAAQQHAGPQRRMPRTPLVREVSFSELAATCMAAAGPDHGADPASVLRGILNMAGIQVSNWFVSLYRPAEGAHVQRLLDREDFGEQMLWDFLNGDSGKILVRNQLAQLLESALVRQLVIGSIRQRFHTPQQAPD